MSTEVVPSRSRSPLDALYGVLSHDRDRILADVVEASGLERDTVRACLAAARAGGVADGTNGRWARHKVSRTAFRDRTVVGFIAAAGRPVTFEEVVQVLPVSRPQLYTTLARLQVSGAVVVHRDGSRTPRYSA